MIKDIIYYEFPQHIKLLYFNTKKLIKLKFNLTKIKQELECHQCVSQVILYGMYRMYAMYVNNMLTFMVWCHVLIVC